VRFTQFTPETNPAAFSNDQQRSVRIVGIRIAGAEVVAQVETSPLVIELVEPHLQDEDGNGVVSVGESAKLIFQLRNRGGLAGRDLRVVATSDDSQVVITDGETLFRDLTSTGTASLSDAIPDGEFRRQSGWRPRECRQCAAMSQLRPIIPVSIQCTSSMTTTSCPAVVMARCAGGVRIPS
jgi:hypothetical protein